MRALLADNVVRLRTARGWTQAQLAQACGLTPSKIGEIEQARLNLTLATLEALTTGLACWPTDLLLPPQAARNSTPARPGEFAVSAESKWQP